jgi:hypothetical protein
MIQTTPEGLWGYVGSEYGIAPLTTKSQEHVGIDQMATPTCFEKPALRPCFHLFIFLWCLNRQLHSSSAGHGTVEASSIAQEQRLCCWASFLPLAAGSQPLF